MVSVACSAIFCWCAATWLPVSDLARLAWPGPVGLFARLGLAGPVGSGTVHILISNPTSDSQPGQGFLWGPGWGVSQIARLEIVPGCPVAEGPRPCPVGDCARLPGQGCPVGARLLTGNQHGTLKTKCFQLQR